MRDENVNEGWEGRKSLWSPENFLIEISIPIRVYQELTYEESHTLAPLIRLVRDQAQRMTAGMLKGVLKYKKKAHEEGPEYILPYLLDDMADIHNYVGILENAWRRNEN